MLRFLAVFIAMAVIDFCWARYMAAVNRTIPVPAAFWSAGIVLLGAFVTVEYVRNPALVFAATAGAFVGTYVSVRRDKTKAR